MTRIARSHGRAAILIAAILCAFGAAPDPGAAEAAAARGAPAPAPAPARAAMVVELDPLPGEGAAQAAIPGPADAGLSRSTEGLVVRTLPGGSRRVDLQGRFRAYSVVTIAADGALVMGCADDAAGALAIVSAAAPRPATVRPPRLARLPFGPREE